MTNPFEPPRKRAFDDAELALAIEQSKDALAAMEILESQAKLRSEDAQAYVAWVRQMEGDGSAEAKAALTAARRQQAGVHALRLARLRGLHWGRAQQPLHVQLAEPRPWCRRSCWDEPMPCW